MEACHTHQRRNTHHAQHCDAHCRYRLHRRVRLLRVRLRLARVAAHSHSSIRSIPIRRVTSRGRGCVDATTAQRSQQQQGGGADDVRHTEHNGAKLQRGRQRRAAADGIEAAKQRRLTALPPIAIIILPRKHAVARLEARGRLTHAAAGENLCCVRCRTRSLAVVLLAADTGRHGGEECRGEGFDEGGAVECHVTAGVWRAEGQYNAA